MTTRKLKEWCEVCNGTGSVPRDGCRRWGTCLKCKGAGYALVDAIDMPDGRVVVVDVETRDAAAKEYHDGVSLQTGGMISRWDDTVTNTTSRDAARKAVLHILAAFLSKGKVYEAKVVGRFHELGAFGDVGKSLLRRCSFVENGGDGVDVKDCDLIAVGLKEVGK